MRFGYVLLCLSSLLPYGAQASIEFGSVTCSDNLIFDDSNGITLSCSGDLSLTDGVVSSDTGIFLRATGDLSLRGLSLFAPLIELSANSMQFFSDVTLTGESIIVSATNGISRNGELLPARGGNLSVVAGREIVVPDREGLELLPMDRVSLSAGGDISLEISRDGELLRAREGNLSVVAAREIVVPDRKRLELLLMDRVSFSPGGNIALNATAVPIPGTVFQLLMGLVVFMLPGLMRKKNA